MSDCDDVSTPELLQKVANAYGCRCRLFHLPVSCINFMVRTIGSGSESRLTESLRIDSDKSINDLGWRPIVTMDGQLRAMAARFVDF